MARTRTVDFLPEIFQTSTNRQFLSATLDQLVQEPNFKKIQGFVGRRVGPGINADDHYVTETDPTRADYQLEPGVVLVNPDNSRKIKDAITYPGITDALNIQGADTNRADRLYTSEYYAWDPFVDFDKFINFSQYYWLPAGPDAVDVYAETVPLFDNFVVNRENGVYTFSGINGNNPNLTLIRDGTYTFQVAQNNKETVNYRVTNKGTSAWVLDYQDNPTLTLARGNTYVFTIVPTAPLKFYIKTQPTLGTNNLYNTGVTNNGAFTGTITFVVPQNAPDVLYYNNDTQMNMQGTINIVDGTPGTGPGFWIQTDPGVNGQIPATPNISSRDVLGVVNNGEDLGTVTFNVPLSTAQDFYYNLDPIAYNDGKVDLVTSLNFDQINNQFISTFAEQNPNGIDGITNLNGRTVVFLNQTVDPDQGGWLQTTQFDPLPNVGNAISGIGSFDSTTFDQTTIVPENDRYGVWQVQYITASGGGVYMTLTNVASVPTLQKFTINFGTTYASTQWYKNTDGYFEQMPLLTANRQFLYYQDGTDPEIFGRFKLINDISSNYIDIDDILGKKNYTSPNGVVFTNGLKINFPSNVLPSSYQNNTYYVEGVGTAIQLLPVTNYVTPETYTQSASIPFDSLAFDVGNFDADLNQPLVPDYLTINRASADLNAWSRSNRWFHIDVINASAEYNNVVPSVNNEFRAKRPVLEFRAGTRVYNFGTKAKQPVNIIDFSATDALSNINGTTGYGSDGYQFISGSRVIFAADLDSQVRNKIYQVEFIVPDPATSTIPVINLVPATDYEVLYDNTVVCLSGNTQQGLSYWFDGVDWFEAQQKTNVNQAPLFNVYDSAGVSFDNRIKYPSSNFFGSKLFSYAQAPGNTDPVLGFPIKYLSLSNIGDIVFENNLYTDTFTYTRNSTSTTDNISLGFVREYTDRVIYLKEIGWQTAITKSRARQQFRFVYDGSPLRLDIAVIPDDQVPSVQVFVGATYVEPSGYTVTTTSDTTTIILSSKYVINSVIEVDVLSDQSSKLAFYQVPVNLENNPLNVNSAEFTLGTARAHYNSIGQNLINISGPINGANNTRDLGNLVPYGQNILQQSAPMTLAGYFMRSTQYNVFASLEYNSNEYERFKVQLLDSVIRNDYTNYTIPAMLTAVMADINAGRTSLNPFYWSDMLPANPVYTESTTTYTAISTPIFNLSTTYNFTSSNYQGLLVYVNDVLLQFAYEYTVATDAPTLTITAPLNVGDVIVIQEYVTTYGSFVPNTPTKLGLYPAFRPRIYLDTTYINPTIIIQGHDGSKTVAFGDFRDQLLLEFETRIFNNLKIKSDIPLSIVDVTPGQFRTTDYTLGEVNQILSTSFLNWVGWNKIAYQPQNYIADNQFTWNYSTSGNRISDLSNTAGESPLPVGAWRGIYQYFYDTPTPQSTPWEMLGLSQMPSWWTDVYGPAPYTSGNLVLWDDLAQGKVADPAGVYYKPKYARPGLTQVLPVDSEGQLLSPFQSVVGLYDSSQFQKSWTFGDEGPAEYSWRSSSSYPFAVMRLLALTRPAEFFSLFADRDLYKYDTDLAQYLYNQRYRLDANGIQVYGGSVNPITGAITAVSKASFINWIVDYNQQLGKDSTTDLTTDLANLDVRLCYRMGAFSDKQYLKIYTEKSSPNSQNSSLLLPDESYNLLLYKNQPFDRVLYSSVIIQVVEDGYAVFGYSLTQPYFEILASRTAGTRKVISAGGETVSVPDTYYSDVVQIPYGYTFTNTTVVADFLLSYGALLQSQGMIFDDTENGHVLNWDQMAQEFLYWVGQGWAQGSIINLNPTATSLTTTRSQAIVDSVLALTPENLLLDQNRNTLPVRDLVVDRYENTFKITSLSSQTISYIDLRYTSYESMVVLDNVSIFADLLYDPATGARQGRVNIVAQVSADWNGQLDAQGFVLNNDATVEQWKPYRKYTKGEIVLYKNSYWSAAAIVQPKAEFLYSDWLPSDYTKIQRGLLQNLPNFSNQLANSYNVNAANLEQDSDLLAYGLIGFRPRQYMTDLNLNDISQVNLYQQFIHDKGTLQSVRLLTNADLGKETAEYQIFENWAVQRGVYGANANRSFIELRLNEALLLSDPSVIQVVEPQETSSADQTVLYTDLWRESYKINSPQILPTTTVAVTDTALPSAGYANLDDVDVTVFSLDAQLGTAPGVLNTIGPGTIIWAAKSNRYDWNIYRSSKIPGHIVSCTSNLNTTSIVQFTQAHGLLVGDIVVIRFFNALVDGVYRVLAVPNLTSIVIEIALRNTITGNGIGFVLDSARVAQASDVLNLPFVNDLVPGAKAWVDNNGQGLWEVIEKQQPFVSNLSITPALIYADDAKFGSSIAQGYNNIMALVGSPGYESTGAIYPYLINDSDGYGEQPILLLGATDTVGYGNAVDIGYQSWAVAGASASASNQGYASIIYRASSSAVFEQVQILIPPEYDGSSGEQFFGTSVAISQDERWIYVGAPGVNKVYAYGRVDIELQSVRYIASGTTNVYSINGIIEVEFGTQLNVVLNNVELVAGVDYELTDTTVSFTTPPLTGQTLIIARRYAQEFTGNGSTINYDLGPYLYTISPFNIYSFSVAVDGILQRPGIDYGLGGTVLQFTTPPANGVLISMVSKTYFDYMSYMTGDILPDNANFGQSVTTATDGRQIIIGASVDNSDELDNSGSVYVFNRSVERFIVTNEYVADPTFPLPSGFETPVGVILNNQYLINDAEFFDGTYVVNADSVTITTTLNIGDVVEIESNIFTQVQKITANVPFDEAQFGGAVALCPYNCSIYIGAPNDGSVSPGAGSVERRVNQARVYGVITSTIANPSLTIGDTIFINNTVVEVPAINTVVGFAAAINAAAIPNVHASASDGYLTINVVNVKAADEFNRLSVWPGLIGNAYDALGFAPYAYTQTIVSPNPVVSAHFGTAISIDSEGDNLVIGAPRGITVEITTFDAYTELTYFDDQSTRFFEPIVQSGAVYTFDYLPSASDTVTDPGKFVFGQQVLDSALKSLAQWGAAVNYTGSKLLIGSPTYFNEELSVTYGRVAQFDNPNRQPAWTVIHQQQPVVDVYLLNSVFMYNKLQGTETYFLDFFDPLQGKILGAAQQNIDYVGAIDPAKYNAGPVNDNGNFWGEEHLGEIWWNTDSVRFIDPNQDDITYASRRWGQTFPGSRVEIYQWVGSNVPPANYTGPGTVLNTESFTVRAKLNARGIVTGRYYFWVTNLTTIDTGAGKTLSTTGIARYIESPRSSGIPYLAALNSSTVAIYNSLDYLSASDTILHIEFDRVLTSSNTHTEVELIGENKPESFLSANLYRKLQDSFCGVNSTGAKVPDPFLSPAERYGVQFRPRQSMFVDRLTALKNYLGRVNTILAQLPIVELRSFRLLNSKEPIPTRASNEWDKQLTNIEQLSFQDLYTVPLGYRYLVDYDATNNGLWTIYQVIEQTVGSAAIRTTQLARVQTYDTTKYWDHIDWYQVGYNNTKVPTVEVPNYSALVTLNATVGTIVKVTANAQGKFEIYLLTDLGWDRVGLQDGTIEFSRNLWDYSATGGQFGFDMEVFDAQYFDQEPVIETRKIIQAINEELFIADLAIERNRLLILMFNFVLTEFAAPDWLNKTSLIDVKHIIRELVPYQIYRPDNQQFVYDYLQEVKPYHVQVKEFYLAYQGLDQYFGSLTDFDSPSYYDTTLSSPQYINPILLPYTKSTAAGTGTASDIADTASNATIWTQYPWTDWFNNYTLGVVGMTINNAGSGYVEAPKVTIGTEWTASTAYNIGDQIFYRNNLYTVTGAGTTSIFGPTFESGSQLNGTATLTYAGVAAQVTVIINSAGSIASVTVVESGSGYLTTPLVSLDGIASYDLVPVMGNSLVRSIKTTMKYDRYEYSSNITNWSYTVSSYTAGTQVRYLGQVWQATNTITNSPVITTATGAAGSYVVTVASTAGLVQGLLAVAFGIPTNTTIVDFDSNTNTVTLTRALLSAMNSLTVDFYNVFNPDQWTRVAADSLSGVNRTIGFYSPTANQPGRQLSLLIDGIDYPGVQVFGPDFNQNTGFDVGNFDINPFDNISYGPDGLPTYDYGILDAIYSSPYVDPYLGTRATDINVDGGAYVDTYSSHAPEELVPGAEFDTLDMRVYTRPGADWFGRGHGFPEKLIKFVYTDVMPTVSYGDLLPYPILVKVANQTWGLDMHEGIDYTVDYVSQTVTVIDGANDNDVVVVTAYELGGGNQLYKQTYIGSDIGNTVTVPVAYDQIYEFAIFVNGIQTTDFIYADAGNSQTTITFVNTYTDIDFISLVVIGPTTVDSTEVDYSWSVPITQIIAATGSLTYMLDNSLEYTNPDNLIVTVDGARARTAAGIEWYGDGSTEFLLPDRLGVSQSQILDSQVHVYLDEIAQQLSTDFTVTPYDPLNGHNGRRSVVFTNEPTLGTRILITVETGVQAYVNSNQLVFVSGAGLEPSLGQTIAVTTWNDTRQQNILTQVFVGPTTQGVVVSEGYDDTDFDTGTVSGEPGSFDYSTGTTISVNNLDLGRVVPDPDRLNVTLNGRRLFSGQDFTINDTELILTSGLLNVLDTVMITQVTQNVVPEPMAFRIFQDMRGSQTVYRITPGTTTVLTQELSASADVIYVADAGALQQPNVAINIWGVITIGGERIMYRERNTVNNTVSGLLRGTAGTSVYTHAIDSTVYNMGSGNMLPAQFQNYILENTFLGDGTTAAFETDMTIVDQPKVYLGGSIAVTVNDILQPSSSWTLNPYDPVAITLTEIPVAGSLVVVTVTDLHGTPTSNTFTSTGSSGAFTTNLSLGLTLQSQLSYTIDNLNPVTVTFNSAVASGLAIAITDAAGLGDTTQIQFGTGYTVTYQSNVDLTQPVIVYVGGTEQSSDTYTVTSITPISVMFDTAPPSGVDVTILVRQGVTWYQQGATTPSNGVPLQITNTQAARFLRGL